MGTHSRNAVTQNGVHICCEQSMDGFDAVDIVNDILNSGKIPPHISPTMSAQTNECEQLHYAHVDYDHKILFISLNDPREYLLTNNLSKKEMNVRGALNVFIFDENKITETFAMCDATLTTYLTRRIINIKQIEKSGWRIVFNCTYCCKEYDCINSNDDFSIERIIK